MTLESLLPYLSVAAAAGAGFIAGGRSFRAEAGLKTAALACLGLFAYLRWIAPASIALAVSLQAIGHAIAPGENTPWRWPAVAARAAGWLVLAKLFFETGDGRSAFFGDAIRAGLFVLLMTGAGVALRRLWPNLQRPRLGAIAQAAAAVVLLTAALTLDWGFWPAILGAAAVLASEAALLLVLPAMGPKARRALTRSAWTLAYLGQVATAYAFLR